MNCKGFVAERKGRGRRSCKCNCLRLHRRAALSAPPRCKLCTSSWCTWPSNACRCPRLCHRLHSHAALSAPPRCKMVRLARKCLQLPPLMSPIAPPCSIFCTTPVQSLHHRGALDPQMPAAARTYAPDCTAMQHFLHHPGARCAPSWCTWPANACNCPRLFYRLHYHAALSALPRCKLCTIVVQPPGSTHKKAATQRITLLRVTA